MNDLFQTNGIYFDNIKHKKKMSNYYILKPSLSLKNFQLPTCNQFSQLILAQIAARKKMHCAQLQADKKEFVSKCQSFQYFLALFTRIRFFCYEKIEIAKNINLQIFFCYFSNMIFFVIWGDKTIYIKQFWLNLLYPHVKKSSK